MIKIWKIDAVHPIAKRIIKSNLTTSEMEKLKTELLNAGYDIEDMECSYKTLYENNDLIEIKLEYIKQLENKNVVRNAIEVLNMIYEKKIPKVIYCTVVHERIDKFSTIVMIQWIGKVNEYFTVTNTSMLESLGYRFKKP